MVYSQNCSVYQFTSILLESQHAVRCLYCIDYLKAQLLMAMMSFKQCTKSHSQTLSSSFIRRTMELALTFSSAAFKSDWKSQPGNWVNSVYKEKPLQESFPLNPDGYAWLLQVCAEMKELSRGKQIHVHLFITGHHQDAFLATKLVNMYSFCGTPDNARLVFDRIRIRNVFLWNAMIRGYATNGVYEGTLKLFYQMQFSGIYPDNFTYPFVLKACAGLLVLKEGKEIHYHITRSGLDNDVFVSAALIDMYAKCGSVEGAREVFEKMPHRNVVFWTAMIVGYVQNGDAHEALRLFTQMKLADVVPDSVILASVLPACADLGDLQQGKSIHGCILRSGFEEHVSVGTALVDMYAKCGSIDDAGRLFDKMSKRDAISWNATIAGYAQNGHANEALSLFHRMQLEDVMPNSVTMVSVLPACTNLAALQQGKWIHAYIIRSGFESNVSVGNSLVDMYAKCGSIEVARQFFEKMTEKDVVSWSVMIAGYGIHGYVEVALELFSQMRQTGMKPDHVTLTAVLSACRHAGFLDEGKRYFDCMMQDYSLTPRMEHYACMVDLLGRAGNFGEAQDLIKKMPVEPDANVWGALLGACRIHSNIELGKRVSERLLELDPNNAGNYVLLSNMYATSGRWDDVLKVRTMLKDRGLKKSPGCSWIEIKNSIHAFIKGDQSHPESEQIYSVLYSLAGQMKQAGYVPDTSFVLHNVEEEEKGYMLCNHSEKLAIAYGLIKTSPATPIRITKNLRVCGDCHIATKLISKIAQREIIVRDAHRFHHFKEGLCSCGDYW